MRDVPPVKRRWFAISGEPDDKALAADALAAAHTMSGPA
jgi:hypothetical protein